MNALIYWDSIKLYSFSLMWLILSRISGAFCLLISPSSINCLMFSTSLWPATESASELSSTFCLFVLWWDSDPFGFLHSVLIRSLAHMLDLIHKSVQCLARICILLSRRTSSVWISFRSLDASIFFRIWLYVEFGQVSLQGNIKLIEVLMVPSWFGGLHQWIILDLGRVWECEYSHLGVMIAAWIGLLFS